jgi:hypothetical protein
MSTDQLIVLSGVQLLIFSVPYAVWGPYALIFENTQNCYYCDKIFENSERQVFLDSEDCETLSEMGYEEPEDFEDCEEPEYFEKPKKSKDQFIKVRDHDHLRPQLFYLLVYGSADVKFQDFGK